MRGLILMDLNISAIFSESPKSSGRGDMIRKTPVAVIAIDFNKKLIETSTIDSNIDFIAKLKPDIILLADFGQIIPEEILKLPKIGAFNLHPSLLPKYRGSTPIQTAILNGEKETGVSLIRMSKEIDKGKIIAQKTIKIQGDENSYSLEIRLANLSLKMMLEALPNLQDGNFIEIKQDDSRSILTHKFSKADAEINWQKPVIKIERQIRAFYPWPGSFTKINDKRLLIHSAHLDNNKLVLDIVQMEGKRAMLFSEFLKGFREKKPSWFKKLKLSS